MKIKLHMKIAGIAVMVLAAALALPSLTWADHTSAPYSGAHHSILGGPWEVVIKMGLDGDGLRFPVDVSDENKPQNLDTVLPVLASPIKVKLEQYVPDLTWETDAIKHPGGGIAARLAIKGKSMEQHLWLSPEDPARQSVSSPIGSISIRRLHNPDTAEALMRKVTDPKAVGVLSIWSGDGLQPFECVIRPKETVIIPASRYKVTIAQYLPHYAIDIKTKKVFSQSDRPVNPAVKVLLNDGSKTVEHWLWARFPSSPHESKKLPFRMRFTDFDLGDAKESHIITVASGTRAWTLRFKKRKKRWEKVVIGRAYPLADKDYAFSIEQIVDGAIIKTEWKNRSDRLLHPALVATIMRDGTGRQAVLELDKPVHLKTKSGVLVLLYRRRPSALRAMH
jgi:hypothetical protein